MSAMEEKTKEHDYTEQCWGWAILNFKLTCDEKGNEKANVMAVGYGIEEGHQLLLRHGKHTVRWDVTKVEYDNNPRDLFNADLSISCIEEDNT